MTKKQYKNLKKGDSLFFARTMPVFGYYEIHEVHLVTKYDDHCTITDTKTKQSFLLDIKNVLTNLFIVRKEASDYLKSEKEKNKKVKVYNKESEKDSNE